MKKKFKPGPGWRELNPAVWEKQGFRVHTSGNLLRYPDGYTMYFSPIGPLMLFVKVTGGNYKRGLMAYANLFISKHYTR